MKNYLVLCLNLFLLLSCSKNDNPSNPDAFVKGKNRFTISVDGDVREYYVHVPQSYNGASAFPLVIFFHGTSGNGEKYYNISGWKEEAEVSNILTVYPSSWEYCIIEGGVTKTTTKWHSLPGSFEYCTGSNPKDDIKFMKAMIASLENRFKIDNHRIYTVGFSNGGQFSARCAIELSDVIAGAISSGGGGALANDSVYSPIEKIPVMLQFGNLDDMLLENLGIAGPLPMNFNTLFSTYPILYGIMPKPYINSFMLDEVNYTVSGDTTKYLVADFHGLSGSPLNVFKMVEVYNLEHEYPNGINHPLNGAAFHWAWLKTFSKP